MSHVHIWNAKPTCFDLTDVRGMCRDVLIKCKLCGKYRLQFGRLLDEPDILLDGQRCSGRKRRGNRSEQGC